MAQYAASGASMAIPPIGIPLGIYEAYQGYNNQNPIQGLLGGLTTAGGVAGTIAKAPGAALKYAEGQRKLSPVNINIEATSPSILQKASETLGGRALSDLRYGAAQEGAAAKGMKYANVPPSKVQGVWVDPASNVEEFNRVYSQNLGPINRMNIQKSGPLSQYAQSMGGDVAKSPKYGLLDSAYFDTSAAGQGAYMNPVDELLRLRGF